MGKIIFSALIIAGLCFGQGIWLKENPKINLPILINGAIRSADGTNEITMRKFALYSSQTFSSISPLNPNNLMMQVEGESLQPKTSFWKQAGIYGLEFVGAGAATYASARLSWWLFFRNVPFSSELDPDRFDEYLKTQGSYIIINAFLAGSSTWMVGRLFKQKGSWTKSIIGGGIGSLTFLPFALHNSRDLTSLGKILLITFFILPMSGATIGYNLK